MISAPLRTLPILSLLPGLATRDKHVWPARVKKLDMLRSQDSLVQEQLLDDHEAIQHPCTTNPLPLDQASLLSIQVVSLR